MKMRSSIILEDPEWVAIEAERAEMQEAKRKHELRIAQQAVAKAQLDREYDDAVTMAVRMGDPIPTRSYPSDWIDEWSSQKALKQYREWGENLDANQRRLLIARAEAFMRELKKEQREVVEEVDAFLAQNVSEIAPRMEKLRDIEADALVLLRLNGRRLSPDELGDLTAERARRRDAILERADAHEPEELEQLLQQASAWVPVAGNEADFHAAQTIVNRILRLIAPPREIDVEVQSGRKLRPPWRQREAEKATSRR